MDNTLLKDLHKLREKEKKILENEKLSVVCEHILLAEDRSMEAYNLKGKSVHPKHDGNVYCCLGCSLVFSTIQVNPNQFKALPFRQFERKLTNVKER